MPAELRRSPLRVAAGLAVLAVALIEVRGAVHSIQVHAGLRDALARTTRAGVEAIQQRVAAALAGPAPMAWEAAAREALGTNVATEFELFEPSGRVVFVRPAAAPVRHWTSTQQQRTIREGGLVSAGLVPGSGYRVLHYFPAVSAGQPVVVRLATAVPELGAAVEEQRQRLLRHGLVIAVLVLAAGAALWPARSEGTGAGAANVYAEALDRLQTRGRDLLRRHEAERQRLEQRVHDREAMARAGELTAGMAHEVRNGLATILAHARLIEQGGAPPGEFAAAIRAECETLETMVQRFMEFVREEKLRLEDFDLRGMLTRVAARESRARGGAAVVIAPGDLGRLVGDEDLLERAFENLVRNARHAAGPGGHVWVDARRDAGALRVTIADDGPGLTPEARRELRPFYTTKPGGLGLGLPIALKLIALHQGEIVLGQRAPRGLSVEVRLPARPRAVERSVTEGIAEDPPAATSPTVSR